MHHVYLDQNKWIDLARARTGHPKGQPFVDTYHRLCALQKAGKASFPLSGAHYFETHTQGDESRRRDLATTMVELSNFDAIAPPQAIVPWEIECALIDVFGLDAERPSIEIFGRGANHVFASNISHYESPDEWEGVRLDPEMRAVLNLAGSVMMEYSILADVNHGQSKVRLELNKHMRLTGDKFAQGQREVRERLDEVGHHRMGNMMVGTALRDIIDPLAQVAARLGIEPDVLFGSGRDKLVQLVKGMPSRWVEAELRRVRQANPQKDWEGNDLNDVTALSIAVPYCDLVVTERSWSGMINTRKISRPFETRVLRDLRELPDLLDRGA